jgi:AcrR family transcriptional regulator
VGRSTFYEHFRGKEDVLQHSMKQVLEALADIAADPSDPMRTRMVIAHIGTHRPQAFRILDGPAGRAASRQLASLIETRLAESCGRHGVRPIVPIALVASQIAGAQLGLLRAWVAPVEEPCSSSELAAALHRSTRALSSLGSASKHRNGS